MWFAVRDDDCYKDKGLKGFVIDLDAAWEKVFKKFLNRAVALKKVYEKVEGAVEGLVGKLGAVEVKSIHAALAGRPRLNQVYDLLGIDYPNLPVPSDEGGHKKLKRSDAVARVPAGGKRGRGRCHGPSASSSKKLATARVSSGGAAPARAGPGVGGSSRNVMHVGSGVASGGSGVGAPVPRLGGIGDLIAREAVDDDEEEEEEDFDGFDRPVINLVSDESSDEGEGSDDHDGSGDDEEEAGREGSVNSPAKQPRVGEEADEQMRQLGIISPVPQRHEVPQYDGSHI